MSVLNGQKEGNVSNKEHLLSLKQSLTIAMLATVEINPSTNEVQLLLFFFLKTDRKEYGERGRKDGQMLGKLITPHPTTANSHYVSFV